MKIKVAVNLNRIPSSYTIQLDFERVRLYFLKHGVELEFLFKNVSLNGYLSVWTGSRWVLNQTQNLITPDPTAEIDMFVFDRAEWKTPTGSQFPLKPNAPTGNAFIANNKPFVNAGSYAIDNGMDTLEIAHELMHALVYLAKIKGFNIQDVMDITPIEVSGLTGEPLVK